MPRHQQPHEPSARAAGPFRVTDRLSDSERAMLMSGACARAYRWTPKK